MPADPYSANIQSYIFLLYTGIALAFAGLAWFQIRGKAGLSLLLIAFGGLSLNLLVCFSDAFLHMWDEQIHAVVAKNMVSNPFKPMLVTDPVLPYNYKGWLNNHVWLHKQPLFLWQIALSFKLFGTSVFSLRLPSILMTTLLVFPVFRIGKIISGTQTGIYAALLVTGSNFIYQLSSGRLATDHNDIAFLFYVTLSIWAFFEKEKSGNRAWIIFIGLFSGAAILNKWLVGLLVYAAWGLSILVFKENRKRLQRFAELSLGLLVTIVVALPWQLYILYRFPQESRHEFSLNTLHFFKTVEGHAGDFMYHLSSIERLYGTDFQYVILVSLIIFLFSAVKTKFKFQILSLIFFVYAFYSFAATKMPAFTIIVAPLVYVMVAHSLTQILKWIGKLNLSPGKKRIVSGLSAMALVFFVYFHFLNHEGLAMKNIAWQKKDFQHEYKANLVYLKLIDEFGGEDVVVYNTWLFDRFKIMFLSDFYANIKLPSKKSIETWKENNFRIVVFDDNKLPDYILTDSTIAKVRSAVYQKDFEENIEVYY